MTRRLNLILLILMLVFGLPSYWFLLDNSGATLPVKPIPIAELRRLAAAIPGEAPYAVEVERAAFRRVPGDLLVAGSGIKRKLVGYMAFRLLVRGGRSVMIESGITPKIAAASGAEQFNLSAQARIDRALDLAGLILVTHEHPDHLGALVAHGGSALLQAAWLNPRQLPPAALAAKLGWHGAMPPPRLNGLAPQAVAPGVVVIPAPDSHTPGSQLIYVRLADGHELLFAGDNASFAQNWQQLRGRSRLVETWFAPENRAEVFAWLKTIRAWKAQAPGLLVVPGHDWEWLADSANKTGVRIGFSPIAG
jgi:glyoxylase-like metal-dependent hydrolase (beta-lactamase superfamily II)